MCKMSSEHLKCPEYLMERADVFSTLPEVETSTIMGERQPCTIRSNRGRYNRPAADHILVKSCICAIVARPLRCDLQCNKEHCIPQMQEAARRAECEH